MDNKQPDFTIVTASYNQGLFLEQTIKSVLSQRDVSLEYIIIDGGSTDNSIEIINKYKNFLFYSISESDNGCPDALNKGMSLARGKYFMYLNSDDFLIDNVLCKVFNYLENSKNADIYLGHGIERDERHWVEYPAYSAKFSLDRYLRGRASVFQQGTIFRTLSIKNKFKFNVSNKSCWDGEFLVDLALSDLVFSRLPFSFIIGVFRLHHKSISGSGSHQSIYFEDMKRIKNKIILQKNGYSSASKRGVLRNYIEDPELIFARLISKIAKKRRI